MNIWNYSFLKRRIEGEQMNIYQRALQFYLDSSSYLFLELDMFFDVYSHCGTCEYDNKEYSFESTVYRTYEEKMITCTKEFHTFDLKLTDSEIKRYFTGNYSNGQLAAVIFAHWFGLTKKHGTLTVTDVEQE